MGFRGGGRKEGDDKLTVPEDSRGLVILCDGRDWRGRSEGTSREEGKITDRCRSLICDQSIEEIQYQVMNMVISLSGRQLVTRLFRLKFCRRVNQKSSSNSI